MSQKLSNDNKYKYRKYRIFLWYMIIITGFMTIVLSLFSLFSKISPIYAIISFILEVIFTKMRTKLLDDTE